jgi:hypothetical protein
MSLALALGSYGLFTALSPFAITQVNYQVTQLNLISALVSNGVDVFNSFYAPAGLLQAQFTTDLTNGAAIVTLESENGPTVNIPSSYLSTSPVEPAVAYHGAILFVDLGDLPDAVSLDQLTSDITVMAEGALGVTATVTTAVKPAKKLYSYAESLVLEAERQVALTTYLSFYSGKVAADAELAAVKLQLGKYADIIKSQITQIEALKAQLP